MREAIRRASKSPAVGEAFRVIEFSVQNDHVHLLVEAHDEDVLSRGLRGLVTRLARAVNRALDMHGPVWGDRYHARALKTPRAVRNAIVYVLMNAKKHGVRVLSGWFGGFAAAPRPDVSEVTELRPVRAPRTWLAGVGWRRRGLVRLDERPRAPD